MTADMPVALVREGLAVLAVVGAPFVGALLVVGLIVGLLQSATQINDPAVGFLPRLVAGVAVSWAVGGWAVERLARFFGAALARMAGQ
jgi:flagellar biosynthesis protein FliQ